MRRQHSYTWIAPLALALLLALVFHDAAMAGDPHATAFERNAHSAAQHASHAALAPNVASSQEASATTIDLAHPDDCGVALPAIAPRTVLLPSHASGTSVIPGFDGSAQVLPVEARHPPMLPPNVRRALFQVYRI